MKMMNILDYVMERLSWIATIYLAISYYMEN